MRNYKSIILPVLGFILGFLLCFSYYKKENKKVEYYKEKFIEADSLRLIYSTYIVDDEKLHEGCLKAGSYGNYKQTTN
jgi:hypothetical protein